MDTLLYVKANPKSDEESSTFRVSESFIETYREYHPEDEIVILDLYRGRDKTVNENTLKIYLTRDKKQKIIL